MKSIVTILCFALALAVAGPCFAADQPNIVYILLDDAGWGDLGCYGQQKLKTPNMDRLASDGMRFTQHYSGSTVCAPTRSVLMTGQHTGHTYIRGNNSNPMGGAEGQFPISDETVTVAELLKDAGYATGAFGKWGLGAPGNEGAACEQGFDTFYGYYCQALAHDYYPRWIWRNDEKIVLDRKEYSHDLIMAEALDFIRENKDGPFFCYLPVTIPHAAMQAPEEMLERFRKEYPQFNNKVGKYGGDARTSEVVNPIAGFAAMMTVLDDDVGELLALLKDLGIDENTVVMLSSDNGPHREGGHDPVFWDSNGPFQGTKRDLYEGGIRCPLLIRWPGKVEAGQVSDHISAHWDMLPTFCDLADIETPDNVDGISLLPTMLGEGDQPEHEYLYWEFYEQGGKRAVRLGDWKAVQRNLKKDPNSPIELYDLSKDPGEEDDIAADHPEIVERMKEIMEDAHTPDANWKFR